MKICKVRSDRSTCSACIATQEMFNVVDDCSKCKSNTDIYELLQIGTGFWSGDYAMVQKDGKITKVSLSRVYDVKVADLIWMNPGVRIYNLQVGDKICVPVSSWEMPDADDDNAETLPYIVRARRDTGCNPSDLQIDL